MACFINFEADIEGHNEEIGKEDDKFSSISHVDSENSFIDNQEVKPDVSFYRHFANVENDTNQVLKDAYNETLEDIDKFDEISNLCEGSEEEAEIDDFKNFEIDIKKSTVISTEYQEKQRKIFKPIDVIYKPTKRIEIELLCYFYDDISRAYSSLHSKGKKGMSRAHKCHQCYYCNKYFILETR